MSLSIQVQPVSLFNLGWLFHVSGRGNHQDVLYTPDYKGLQVELETTETCYTSFLSLKRPDFKNVIFKILEVSPCNSPAKQHSPFSPNQGGSGRIGCAA